MLQSMMKSTFSDRGRDFTMSCVESLLADFERLLDDSETSDVVIVCQGEEIRVHRLILSAR